MRSFSRPRIRARRPKAGDSIRTQHSAAGIQMAPPRDSICTQRPFFAPGRTRFGPFCVVVNTGGRCPIHLRQYRTQELKGPGTCQMLPSRLASEASWCPPCIARGRSHHGSTPTQLAGDRVICVRSSGSVWIKNQEPALPVASGFRTSLLCTVHLGLGFFFNTVIYSLLMAYPVAYPPFLEL